MWPGYPFPTTGTTPSENRRLALKVVLYWYVCEQKVMQSVTGSRLLNGWTRYTCLSSLLIAKKTKYWVNIRDGIEASHARSMLPGTKPAYTGDKVPRRKQQVFPQFSHLEERARGEIFRVFPKFGFANRRRNFFWLLFQLILIVSFEIGKIRYTAVLQIGHLLYLSKFNRF